MCEPLKFVLMRFWNKIRVIFQRRSVVATLILLGVLWMGWQGLGWWKHRQFKAISMAKSLDAGTVARLNGLQAGDYELLLYRKVVAQLGTSTGGTEALSWIQYLSERGQREGNGLAVLLSLSLRGSVLGNQGQHDSACLLSQQALRLSVTQDSAPVIDIHNSIALNRYFMGQTDSALKHWKLAYRRAKDDDNTYSALVIANNLGTYYYNTGMLEMAKKYFLVADEMSVKEHQRNPVVVNNLVSILMSEGQTAEANRYWRENAKLLQGSMKSYYGQLYMINEALLDQLSGRWGKARDLLRQMPRERVEAQLMPEYLRLGVLQMQYEKRYVNAGDEAFYRERCFEQMGTACVHLGSYLTDRIQRLGDRAMRDSVYAFFASQAHVGEHRALAAAAKLLLQVGVDGLPVDVATLKLAAAEHALAHLQAQNEQRKSEDVEILEFERLSFRLTEQQRALGDLQVRQWVLVACLLLAVLIAGLLWMIYRKNAKIAAIGAEKSRLEIQGLENEISLNGRLVEYSKLIIDKEKDFLHRLEEIRKGLPNEHQVAVKSLIRELDGAARINHQENPFVADSLMQQQDQLKDKYPGFEQLNATEKRILVLTEHLYTSKDIAQMLGCSPQYVRNVRSRIRKKISE